MFLNKNYIVEKSTRYLITGIISILTILGTIIFFRAHAVNIDLNQFLLLNLWFFS